VSKVRREGILRVLSWPGLNLSTKPTVVLG
jgi:hypothetical protein